MNIETIIKNYLLRNDYDGLCNDDCGCNVDDLAPCGDFCTDCEPAYRIISDCDNCDADCTFKHEAEECYTSKRIKNMKRVATGAK